MIGLLSVPGVARDRHPDSWDNLYQLVAGQAVEVKESNVKLEKGIFVGFADQSLTIHTQQQNLVSPRTQFRKFDYVPGARAWIEAGVEAAAGLGIGAGIGAGLSHDSSGDSQIYSSSLSESPREWPLSPEPLSDLF
jgi:hypothetical protein